jgi:hypothetical protein
MTINSNGFRVRLGAKAELKEWPTTTRSFGKPQEREQGFLRTLVAELSHHD